MPRVTFVKKARRDYPAQGIAKGDSYYWWKFRTDKLPRKSKTYPQRSQLTGSSFLRQLYNLEDNLNFTPDETLPDQIQELRDQIEELQYECKDALDNMPYHLQESSNSGMLLQERIDALEDWISELDSLISEADSALATWQESEEEELPSEELDIIVEQLAATSSGL